MPPEHAVEGEDVVADRIGHEDRDHDPEPDLENGLDHGRGLRVGWVWGISVPVQLMAQP